MSNESILVVDDEEDILELVRYNLEKDGFKIECVTSGEDALELLATKIPDLVILDLMLPGIDGLEVAKQLKDNERTRNIPIVMLTAKGEENDIVAGLELGADDYVTKPFSLRVLAARVRAVIRRRIKEEKPADDTEISIGGVTINQGTRGVSVNGKSVRLTFTEFQVLLLLVQKPGWVFTRSQIVDGVRGSGYSVTDRSVDVQIVGLRKKLGQYGEKIETVRGVGYRFKNPT